MGLAGVKNRRKINKDPNNTAWSRNTESFGQKMLRSHGWEPGQYLGAVDAPHAELHTAANASHIRVVLKDDNLGIGARRNQGDECTGLDVFKDLLGRLNGVPEETLQEKRKAREDVRMSAYMHHKYGAMRFVSGGLLVGDKIEELVAQSKSEAAEKQSKTIDNKPSKEKKSKKRKAEAEAEAESDGSEEVSRKEKKKRKKDKSSKEQSPIEEEEDEVAAAKREKKEKKRRKNEARAAAEAEDGTEPEARSKSDRKKKKDKLKDAEGSTPTSDVTSEAEPPPQAGLNRNLARRKFIAQKRRAHMDPQALKQIFMIKT